MPDRDLSATLLEPDLPSSRPVVPRSDPGLLLLAVIWGINFAIIKGALVVVPPLVFNALRFPLAALVLLALMLPGRGRVLPARGSRIGPVMLGLLGNVVYQLLFILGVARTSAGNASLLLATSPAWTVLLSFAAGQERPPAPVWIGVAATLTGTILLVTSGGEVGFGLATLQGDLLLIASAVAWAIYTVGSRPLVQRHGAMPVTAWTLWVGTPVLVVLGLPGLVALPAGTLTPGVWGAVAYAGILSISVAYLLWNRGIRRLGNARAALYSNLVPVVALVAAWVTLGERPTAAQLMGAAVILAGLTVTRPARAPAPSGAPPRETRRTGSPRA
jgi:drug/metabolite transporter (DMT)-like permease